MADRENGSGVEGHARHQQPGTERLVEGYRVADKQAGIKPGLPFSLSTIGPDRSLYYFHENARQFIADIAAVGFDDLEELARKIQGLRGEIDQLELRACAIAGEQWVRLEREKDDRGRDEIATSVPPVEVG